MPGSLRRGNSRLPEPTLAISGLNNGVVMRLSAAFALVALASCASTLAFGQQQTNNRTQAAPANGAQQQPATPPKQMNNNDAAVAGQVMQRNGGSLLKATLTAPVDPGQAKLDNVSFFSVPAPEP